MSKAAKIAVTIGLMVLWALLRSLLEYSDFPLPVLTFIFILIIQGLWAFGRTSDAAEDELSQKNAESEKPIEVSKPVFTFEKEKGSPSIQKHVKKESAISNFNKPQKVSFSMNLDHLNKNYILSLLREKCHPKQFMQPYDAEKVGIANELYSSLKEDCTMQDLSVILFKAIDKLGIEVDTTAIVSQLLNACSPENFFDPYDSEKVSKANELYSMILENKSNIIELINLKEEAINKGIMVIPEETKVDNLSLDNQDLDEQPKTIVNYWRSSDGKRYRLCQYNLSEPTLYVLEEENGDSWKCFEKLKLTGGIIENGGAGAEFQSCDYPLVQYYIKRFGGALVVTNDGIISGIWEWEGFPFRADEGH